MSYYGIDYGLGKTNIDLKIGIRYGVIPVNLVPFIWDYLEPIYILNCEKCGQEIDDGNCIHCNFENNFEELEPVSWEYKDKGYILQTGSDCVDLFIIKAQHYTYAHFCSPCAPGACYLPSHIKGAKPDMNKCYCLGSEWFDKKPEYEIYNKENTMRTTLLDLSNKLVEKNYPDLFDFNVVGDILNLDEMTGSVAGGEGDDVFEFKIIRIGTDNDCGYLTHLDTIVEYDGRGPRETKLTLKRKDS